MSREWKNQFPSRRGIFLVGGGIAFLGLTARLADLQLFRGAEFQKEALDNQIRLKLAPPHRGTIYDRTGRPLATSKRNFYVTMRREQIRAPHTIEDVVEELAKVVGLSDAKRRSLIEDARTQPGYVDLLVADDLTWEQFSQVNVMAPELEGVNAEVGELRSYPLQGAFFHTIGYVKKPDERDILRIIQTEQQKAGENPDSPEGKARAVAIKTLYKSPVMRVGKAGIEASGEEVLKGEPGKIRQRQNANGRVIETLPDDDPRLAGKAGTDVVLNLDAELQNFAIQRFGREPGADPQHPGGAGSVVVIDVETGAVLCMMSTPAPDPNLFVSGIPNGPYEALKADVRNPLYHKAYEGTYPPGSTFKIVVATAALESGAMKPEDIVVCRGSTYYYDRPYHCYVGAPGHGAMNMHNGIKNSCDCYFYEAARRTGIEKIAEVAKAFGLGHRYELGLTGGKAGDVPNDAWKRKRYSVPWMPGDTISAAIGGGYVLATPFELAVMASRIAGGHATPDPHLIASGIAVPDQTITPLGNISEKTLELVRAGMRAVCSPEEHGTAWRHGLLDEKNELPAPYTGARMAGKSGTAQVRAIGLSERDSHGKALTNDKFEWKLRDHGHFVAYAPADKPRYAVAVTIEHGVSGSTYAAPIAKDVLTFCLRTDPGAKKPYEPKKQELAGSQVKPT